MSAFSLLEGHRAHVSDAVDPPPTALDFVALYRERYDPMVRLAYLLTSDRAASEELVQDAFVKVHRQWHRGIEFPKAYLRTAVVNTCHSWGRRKVREREHERRRLEAVPDPELVADEMWDILQVLPERQRAAIVLRYYEDLPEDEIAAVLRCRPATVRTMIHRGLKALRQEIPQ